MPIKKSENHRLKTTKNTQHNALPHFKMSYTRDFCDECIRCSSKTNLQYDNNLEDSMCRSCWGLFFKLHVPCAGCGEQILLPKDEERWCAEGVHVVWDVSARLGGKEGEDNICVDCFKEWSLC